MTQKKRQGAILMLGLAAVLTGCGGGGDTMGSSEGSSNLISAYGSALASTSSKMDAQGLQQSFHGSFLDAGYPKAQVDENIAADAQAYAQAEYSGFANLKLSDATIGDCVENICTLSGTLTNSDADTTSIPFSVRVINTGGVVRIYGDQKTS